MSRYVKELLQQELENKFAKVEDFLVVETKGVIGHENNEMRGVLKAKGIKLAVVKNAMMRRALSSQDRSSAMSLFESGPCTVAYGGDSVVDIAREIEVWHKKIEVVTIKGAFVDGVVMGRDEAEGLSKLASRPELQGQIVMLAQSPGACVAGAIIGPGGIVAGCIKGLIEKLEKDAA
jgi:large subunit ribosomal protein L10